ncbi:hypothetical protein CCACVL1_18496 [Corchorus capsularis]|uniref:PUM-HD domain-containing protein n=1 Tax=Corchorus capsularis TaxID=210143 RepID=A0A1R3HKZ2_COCAP|nr:hypothetical protein CCACVL1_18496 [Corchorus capsularis]
MENSATTDSKNPTNSAASMASSTSLETLQLSFGNLRINNGKIEINTDKPSSSSSSSSSSLPLNGSSKGVPPSPDSSNSESTSSLPSFNGMNLINNGVGDYYHQPYNFSETLNGGGYGLGLGQPYNPYFLTPTPWKHPLLNHHHQVSYFSDFPNEKSPFLPSPTGENPNGFSQGDHEAIINLALMEESSKQLQGLILMKDPKIVKRIFEGVIDNLFQLMISQFGRYLFQKLVELNDEILLQRIMEKLDRNVIYYASIDRYGSYSIKKLIKVLQKSPLVNQIVKTLADRFWELMTNTTGQYVIMECLEFLDYQKNDKLYLEAIDKCLKLATHDKGCGALNQFISRSRGPRSDELLSKICEQVVYLSLHPYGNFVVQGVLGLQNPVIIEKISYSLRGYYVKLSMMKGGSHLVEKCLKSSSGALVNVISEFLQSNQLIQVAKDRYGNYVLQAALRETKRFSNALHGSLVMKLRSYHNLQDLNHGYARNILV